MNTLTGGPLSLLFLGLGLSVAEEWIIQQTSLAPLPFPAVGASYGRLWGVNWIWFLFMLGFESIGVVLVPVTLTELIFRHSRHERWLSNAGFAGCSSISYSALARPGSCGHSVPSSDFPRCCLPSTHGAARDGIPADRAPRAGVLCCPLSKGSKSGESAAAPRLVCLPYRALALPSLVRALMGLIFGYWAAFPFWIPLAGGVVWALLAWTLIRYWTAAPAWDDLRSWALVFGAATAIMLVGFLGSSAWPRADLVGKLVLNILAVVGFALLAIRLRREP